MSAYPGRVAKAGAGLERLARGAGKAGAGLERIPRGAGKASGKSSLRMRNVCLTRGCGSRRRGYGGNAPVEGVAEDRVSGL
ncbi:MAG: hypothetical protein LBH70_05850 [Spirochaetaceae bacterium]|nr:hypothetical protein [Spirochaetaceae bacterium]